MRVFFCACELDLIPPLKFGKFAVENNFSKIKISSYETIIILFLSSKNKSVI